jgi:hypothetical protein
MNTKLSKFTETCTQMLIPARHMIAKTWKQPRCPSKGEWKFHREMVVNQKELISQAMKDMEET